MAPERDEAQEAGPMDYETIRFETAGGVALITLSRPDVMNALKTYYAGDGTATEKVDP